MSNWISVKDSLPISKDASVLVHFANGSIESVHIQYYFDDITNGCIDGVQQYSKWYITAEVTHWMPLPEPPEVNDD